MNYAVWQENYTITLLTCLTVEKLTMQVSLKGARALIKVFTDLQASVEDVQSWFSVGLEPIIGLVSICTSCNLPSPASCSLLTLLFCVAIDSLAGCIMHGGETDSRHVMCS